MFSARVIYIVGQLKFLSAGIYWILNLLLLLLSLCLRYPIDYFILIFVFPYFGICASYPPGNCFQDMVCSPKLSSRTRSFDLILNLAVHAHLLDPVVPDGVSTIDEDYSQELSLDSEAQMGIQSKITDSQKNTGDSSAIDNFESWILNILYEILLLLVQVCYLLTIIAYLDFLLQQN